jgi:hypothetical protein
VAEERWGDFIEWARRARAKPAFDLEEREYRLDVAAAARELIDAARDGRPLAEPVTALRERVAKSLDMLVPVPQMAPLARWAEQDEHALARALRVFEESGAGPEARLERFVEAVVGAPGGDRLPDGGLTIGSLLNFATSPERLPVVRPPQYARLQGLLGEHGAEAATAPEQYRAALGFSRRVESAFREAGVAVRDMIDVESLIALCAVQHELWAGAGEAADSRRVSAPDVYLAACLMYRNEADYLAEWIEFHLLVGVERFFLYDNESDDHHLEVLAPYLEDGVAIRHEWPGSSEKAAGVNALQAGAYNHCISTHGAEARWIAVIDTDEFLFSPTGRPVPEALVEYERWPAVAVNTPRFGTSGHVTRPAGLVLENYTTRIHERGPCFVKCVIDPAAVIRCLGAHRFECRRGQTVDEHGYPVYWNKTKSPSFERLRINHYFARSETDLRAKHERRGSDRGADLRSLPPSEELQRDHASGARDEAILGYLPPLRAALRRHAARHAPSQGSRSA